MAAPYSLPIIGVTQAEERTTPELLAVHRESVVASRRHMLRSILQQAQSCNELAPLVDIDLAVVLPIGSYYAFSIVSDPILPDWPQRVVDQVLVGILGEMFERQIC